MESLMLTRIDSLYNCLVRYLWLFFNGLIDRFRYISIKSCDVTIHPRHELIEWRLNQPLV